MFRRQYNLQEKEKEELGVFGRRLGPAPTSKWAIDTKFVDEDGRSHLHLGVLKYSIDESLFDAALKAGCDVNAADQSKCLPLHYAAMRGLVPCVNKLLKNGSTKDMLDGDDMTPLMLASSHGHVSVVKLLVKAGCNVNFSNSKGELALHKSCIGGHKECIELLLKYKSKVNYPDNAGNTPLTLICRLEAQVTGIIGTLIDTGAKVDKVDNLGRGPLHWATLAGNKESVKTLITANADIDISDKHFRTPFTCAIAFNHPEVLKYLLDAGCDRSTVDGLNGTAMALASLKGYIETVEVLLNADEDPDELGYFGMTPLMASVYECHVDVSEALLQGKADPNIVSRMGFTAMFAALCHLREDTIATRHELLVMLLKYGGDVNHRLSAASIFTAITNGRNCPMSFAIAQGYISFVNILLQAGSDIQCDDIIENVQRENTEFVFDIHEIIELIHTYRTNVVPLHQICRSNIRKQLGSSPHMKISRLPIAPGLKSYLNFDDLKLIKPQRVSTKVMLPDFIATLVDVKACGLNSLKGSLLYDMIQEPVKQSQPPGPCRCEMCQRIRKSTSEN